MAAGACGRWEAEREKESKGPESQYPLQGHTPVTFLPLCQPNKGFTTSQLVAQSGNQAFCIWAFEGQYYSNTTLHQFFSFLTSNIILNSVNTFLIYLQYFLISSTSVFISYNFIQQRDINRKEATV
jgi:hypothetical protein